MSEVWAAIDEETGEVCAMASTQYWDFARAVAEFAPREVRRMDKDEAVDSGKRYYRYQARRTVMVDGGPAFPQDLQGRRGDDPEHQGMTLRDYFAAAALTGLCANPSIIENGNSEDWVLSHAYELADVMLAVRKEESDE